MPDNSTEPVREIIVARHGHAHCNEHRIIAGPACKGLTDKGRQQAQALGKRLADEGGITTIHASTTPRALETAHIIGKILAVKVHDAPELRVPDPGIVEGSVWSEARERWGTDPDNPTRPLTDGETWRAYQSRATRYLADLFREGFSGRVLVVGHTETAASALAVLLRVSSLERLKIGLDYCSSLRLCAVPPRLNEAYPWERWSLETSCMAALP